MTKRVQKISYSIKANKNLMQPVRKIIKSSRSLRGSHPSTKTGQLVQLESALERDFCCLLEFDSAVLSYVEQPVTIEYKLEGRLRRYTPDFLVHYTIERSPILAEVKYRADLRAQWTQLKPKFRAAKHYAAAKGWEFRLYSEAQIQTPYLLNAKFLLRFCMPMTTVRPAYELLLLEIMAQLGESTPTELVLVAFQDPDRQAELLPVLWYLVGKGRIGCNLYQPLTMRSLVWSVDNSSALFAYGQD